jgi:hypothetical protein
MIFNQQIVMFAVVLISWLAAPLGSAQAEDSASGAVGFVRLIHAVSAGTGKLDFLIDGKSVRPEGYQLGNLTGGIALKPATYKLVFRREGVTEGMTKVHVKANDTTILIPFAEHIPATDKKPERWDIRILRLKQHESEDKRTASFVSVSREPELKVEMRQVDGTWEAVFVERLKIARTTIQQARGYLSVRCNGRELSSVSVGAAGNFVSILYEDEKGMLRSKTFQDYKYLSAD